VYHAAYEQADGVWREVQAPGVYAPDAVPLLTGARWVGCGSGFAVYRAALHARLAAQITSIDDTLHVSAREVAILAALVFARGGGEPAEGAAPLYVRDKVALMTHER
jgi:tRNA threonylcarbamoyladenosine biosynthesis protein TsaB